MSIPFHASLAFSQLVYFASLVVKPSPYRPLFMLPVTLGTIHFFRSTLQYHSPLEYTYACGALGQLFVASNYILVTDVQRKMFKRGQKEPAYRLPLLGRVKWAADLFSSCRGIGWSFEPTHALPPPPSVTRTKFIFQELRALTWDVICYELCMAYMRNNPSFAANGYSLGAGGILWRTVNVLSMGIAALVTLRTPYRVLSILCVLTGFWEPQDWVPLFGDLLEAFTLQRFWGRVWHQLLRWSAVSHGRFLAYDVLHLKKGSKASYLVQLYTTFAVTAAIHVAGEYSMLGYWTHKHALRFFLLQPVAMSFETLVIEAAKKLSIRGPWRLLGYLWVVMWFSYTVPGWVDPLFQRGLGEGAPYFGIFSAFLGPRV
ncbi:hypothetical protein AX15_004615 [Amanita polypyramis BW_CC]|nr:hypothetical protein AX15_004615 [Amanita polypyramis BW_CC]